MAARTNRTHDFRHLASNVLRGADPAGKRHSAKAVAAWGEVVGDDIARHTKGFALRASGELVVFVDSAAWAQELTLMAAQITDALNEHLGEVSVRSLRFTVSKRFTEAVTWETREEETESFYRPEAVEPLPLDETETQQAEHIARPVRDPHLREAALRAMIRDLELKKGRRQAGMKQGPEQAEQTTEDESP
jgi:hypothetical protein